MKYSLRSLMRFSIRELLLLTVVVAVLTAWGIDHWRQAMRIQFLETVEIKGYPPLPKSQQSAPNSPKP